MREGQGIWAVETHAELLGLDMAGVHVKGERLIVAIVVGVDVAEEGSSR
jgi:hypothetical protein